MDGCAAGEKQSVTPPYSPPPWMVSTQLSHLRALVLFPPGGKEYIPLSVLPLMF